MATRTSKDDLTPSAPESLEYDKEEEVYKIGLFNKPHGIHGELQFTFTDDIFDRVDCDYLICLLDGIFVPFFIEEYRFVRTPPHW